MSEDDRLEIGVAYAVGYNDAREDLDFSTVYTYLPYRLAAYQEGQRDARADMDMDYDDLSS